MPADRLLHPKCGKSHRVTMLTDLEFRVWTQYLLSADDFGVMHATVVKLQSDNHHLANRPARIVKGCLDALVKCGLIRRFEHQGQPYVFQHDWQSWQKVEYPRATDNPRPSGDILRGCDEATRELFAKHPGGQRKGRRRADNDPSDSEYASRISPEGVSSTRARAPAERLTANGIRLTAVGSEEGPGETIVAPPLDGQAAFRQLLDAYPQNRIMSGRLVQEAFFDAVFAAGAPVATFALLLANLENHKRSHEWRVKGMVPALDRWLSEGLWRRQLDEGPTVAEARQRKPDLVAAFPQPAPGESVWDRCPHEPKCLSVSRCESLQASEPARATR